MPIFEIQGPDGKTYEADAPTMEAAAAAFAPKKAPSRDDSFLGRLKGLSSKALAALPLGSALDAIGGVGSSFAAKPLGEAAGLADIPLHAAGVSQMDPTAVKAAVQSGLTYSPQSPTGQALQTAAGLPGRAVNAVAAPYGNQMGNLAERLGASPETADLVRSGYTEAVNQLPSVLGAKTLAQGKLPGAPAMSAAAEPLATTIKNTNAAGLRLTPEYAGMQNGFAAKAASTAGSEVRMQQELSKYNVGKRLPELVAQQLGVDGDLTPEALNEIKKQENGVHNAVGAVGEVPVPPKIAALRDAYDPQPPAGFDPVTLNKRPETWNTQGLLNTVRQLKADARAGFRATDDPAALKQARTDYQNAQVLDNFLDSTLREQGKAGLADALKASRTRLAQVHSVEDAFNEATGTVDPKSLARDLDNGVPLSGHLLTAAKAYKAFPKVMQAPERLPTTQGGTFIDKYLALHGLMHGNVPQVALGMARPLGRALVNTDRYQNNMVNPKPGFGFGPAPELAPLLQPQEDQQP